MHYVGQIETTFRLKQEYILNCTHLNARPLVTRMQSFPKL